WSRPGFLFLAALVQVAWGVAKDARESIDGQLRVGDGVWVERTEAADRPGAGQGCGQRLGSRQEIVLADLVDAGGHRVPLVRLRGERLRHELVPDRRRPDDAGGVVRQ